MIAHWLRRLMLVELLAYTALGWYLGGLAGLAFVLAAPLVARAVWLGAIHLAATPFAEPVAAGSAAGFAALRAYLGELRAMCWLFMVEQPFVRAADGPPPEVATATPLVVLVHGFGCNRRVWNPLRRHLQADGVASLAITLEPVLADLELLAGRLGEWLAPVVARARAEDRRIVVIGHSMGGILARRCLQAGAGGDRVDLLITLGSPHGGTALARFHPAPNTTQMRPDSSWLSASGVDPQPILCLMSEHDRVVVPQSSALIEGARGHRLAGVGHLAMVTHRRVWGLLRAELRAVSAGAGGSRREPGLPVQQSPEPTKP